MLTANQQQAQQVVNNRMEANGFLSFDDAMDAAVAAIAGQGFNGVQGEPDVFIIIKHNGTVNANGDKFLDAIIHIGTPKQDILNDVNQMLS